MVAFGAELCGADGRHGRDQPLGGEDVAGLDVRDELLDVAREVERVADGPSDQRELQVHEVGPGPVARQVGQLLQPLPEHRGRDAVEVQEVLQLRRVVGHLHGGRVEHVRPAQAHLRVAGQQRAGKRQARLGPDVANGRDDLRQA